MAQVFRRKFALNIASRVLDAFDATFQIQRSTDPTQNTATVTVYNLGKASRDHIHSQPAGVVVELRAGYEDTASPELPVLFRGRLRYVTSTRTPDGNWETTVETGDGDKAKATAVAGSYPTGASLKSVATDLAGQLGGAGNLLQALAGVDDAPSDGPLAVKENGDGALGGVLGTLGLEHSWQDDALQVLRRGGPLATQALVLTPGSGLIGSPAVGFTAAGGRLVKLETLLNADIKPGRRLRVQAAGFTGDIVCREVSHKGDTYGGDWTSEVEGLIL